MKVMGHARYWPCGLYSGRQPMRLTHLLQAALLLLPASAALAWGHQGHRLVALVAQDHLTPVAAERVRSLLGKESMADVASFADEYRSSHPETASWHFVDIPGAERVYVRERDCPPAPDASPWRNCVVDRILFFEAQLKDPGLPRSAEIFALKMLIHLVGDIHQPMHTIGDARGGNAIRVLQFGSTQCGEGAPCNLHATWDEGLLERRGLSEKKYLVRLEAEVADLKLEDKPVGTPASWANASHRAAVDALVQPGGVIDENYFRAEIPVVDRELEFGGLHLAALLNGVFTTGASAL